MNKNNFTKICCFVFSIISLTQTTILAQELDINKIDTSNYYDYNILNNIEQQKYLKGKELSESFLQRYDVINTICNELKKQEHSVLSNVLYKLEDNHYIILDVYDADRDVGFVYIEIIKGGGKEMRRIKSPYLKSHNAEYVELIRGKGGITKELNVIEKLPSNIKIIWAELYRFQRTENKDDDKYLITKDVVTKILIQDITSFIKIKTTTK